MKNQGKIILLIILAITPSYLFVSCTSSSKSEEKIKQEAQKVTVRIDGKIDGTGLIIKKDGNTYYVLTSKHVVGFKPRQINPIEPIPGDPEEKQLSGNLQEIPYQVITHDNQSYTVRNYDTDVMKDPTLDLAIVKFTSNINYPLATLSTEIKLQETVYIYGFKACFSDNNHQNKEEFNQGQITKIDPKSAKADEGYGIHYTNATITGMSGSPVFNQYGQVISIHGKPADKKSQDYALGECSPLDESKFGNNWGISMADFVNSSLASDLGLNVED